MSNKNNPNQTEVCTFEDPGAIGSRLIQMGWVEEMTDKEFSKDGVFVTLERKVHFADGKEALLKLFS